MSDPKEACPSFGHFDRLSIDCAECQYDKRACWIQTGVNKGFITKPKEAEG